jgi:hypothetical protein
MNQGIETQLQNLRRALRCGAMTRAGSPCQCRAVRGRRRCRVHGGLSPGAPRGVRNGSFTDGTWTAEAIEERRCLRSLLRSFGKPGKCESGPRSRGDEGGALCHEDSNQASSATYTGTSALNPAPIRRVMLRPAPYVRAGSRVASPACFASGIACRRGAVHVERTDRTRCTDHPSALAFRIASMASLNGSSGSGSSGYSVCKR